jgi:hypothetical protein
MAQIVVYNTPDTKTNNQIRTQTSMMSAAYDPVDKLRVSTPQALIDTDFEYGTQPTKWETISLQQSRQSVYYIAQSPRTITTVTTNATNTVVLNMADTSGFSVGTPIYIQNSLDPLANGWYLVSAVTASTSVSYTIPVATATSGNQYNATSTYVYLGYYYTNCGINLTGTGAFVTSTNTVSVTTTNPHGLSAGSFIFVTGTTGGTNVNGAWVVATVPTANTFTYASTGAAGTVVNAAGTTNLFARPAGYVEPRAFDGGVAFSAGAAVPNQQLIRQTRRYFRYQSGKGIQFSTGSCMKPSIFNTSITSSGTTVGSTITVTTRYPHNLTVGTTITVSGVDQTGFNGTFVVASTPSLITLTYIAIIAPSATTATGAIIKISPQTWYGSSNRIGFFDQQNGMFFEYDGTVLYAVWRSSVNQINGVVSVTQGSSTVTGTSTQFSTQLKPNDYIVIRGQSYKVLTITSDTVLYISPEYRGATIANAVVSKTIDTRVPQSQWYDPCDGSGPSGYNLDLTKMQMWYIDYSWYGAGVIRWGFRATNGAVTYVYSQQNNNARFEAYMRSGNMAAHYESNGQLPATYLTSTLLSSEATTINVSDTTGFNPNGGTVKITTATQTGAIEYIKYASKSSTTLNGLTRAQTGGSAATTFTYSATAPIAVEYAAPDTVASLSHWGSSVIMDGQFNDDKSLVFNYGMISPLVTTSLTPVPILAIRVAPSVDNGTTGLLGVKEIINRMQLQLNDLQLFTTGTTGYLINLVLNGYVTGTFSANSGNFVSPVSPQSPTTSSFAQVNSNTTATVTISGGESLAGIYTAVAGPTTIDLSNVRDLGNSILGGGTSNVIPTAQAGLYPDGPDILYVVAIPLAVTSASILARISWKEAQA